MNFLNLTLKKDIYYNDKYISLYLKEYEELFSFLYQEDENIFINKTIKRPIHKIGNYNLNQVYYDLETAYGYGGFCTNCYDAMFLERAMEEYTQKCIDENIIAEFMRFHPMNNFPIKENHFFTFNVYDRDTIVIDLSQDILMSYSSKVRNTVKRALEKVEISESDNIDAFIAMYHETMRKNNADAFYFFDKTMYNNLYNLKETRLYEVRYEDSIIAMAFFMFGEELVHYHLSANSSQSYLLNANYALLHTLFDIAKESGKKYFLLGGGTTNQEGDSLLKFKSKFSKIKAPFYISGKIYQEDIYREYNKIWEEQSEKEIQYFLKYRLGI